MCAANEVKVTPSSFILCCLSLLSFFFKPNGLSPTGVDRLFHYISPLACVLCQYAELLHLRRGPIPVQHSHAFMGSRTISTVLYVYKGHTYDNKLVI